MRDEDVQPEIVKHSSWGRRVGIYAAVLFAIFLLGFVPMWLKARERAASLAQSEHQLILVRMQNDLASAVIDARRGDYESARRETSQFFTDLRADVDKGDASNLTKSQRDGVQQLLAGRDELITLLARSDPASADKLSDLYVSYRKVMNS